jgi:hypothetical protein
LAVSKARSVSREELLQTKPKKVSSKVVALTTYGVNNFPIKRHIDQHLPVLASHPDTAFLAKDGFMLAQRQPANLRTLLVQSRFCSNPKKKKPWGSGPCRKSCINCPYMDRMATAVSSKNGLAFPIKGNFDCESSNVVYIITCKRCQIQYIGETKNKLLTRMTLHRSEIKNKAHLRVSQQDKPVSRHFNSDGHTIKDVRVIVARRNNAWNNVARKQTERAYIQLFQTQTPNGLNIFEL